MAGSVTQTLEVKEPTGISTGGKAKVLTFSWTADAADGSVPDTAVNVANLAAIQGMLIHQITTNPGAVAPTAGYDIVINDDDGIDIAGGALTNRSATVSERVVPKADVANSIFGPVPVGDSLTLQITGNLVNGATGTVKLFLYRD